jgi:hypothetical protein
MKTDGHRSGCFFEALLAQLRFEQGWSAPATNPSPPVARAIYKVSFRSTDI